MANPFIKRDELKRAPYVELQGLPPLSSKAKPRRIAGAIHHGVHLLNTDRAS